MVRQRADAGESHSVAVPGHSHSRLQCKVTFGALFATHPSHTTHPSRHRHRGGRTTNDGPDDVGQPRLPSRTPDLRAEEAGQGESQRMRTKKKGRGWANDGP